MRAAHSWLASRQPLNRCQLCSCCYCSGRSSMGPACSAQVQQLMPKLPGQQLRSSATGEGWRACACSCSRGSCCHSSPALARRVLSLHSPQQPSLLARCAPCAKQQGHACDCAWLTSSSTNLTSERYQSREKDPATCSMHLLTVLVSCSFIRLCLQVRNACPLPAMDHLGVPTILPLRCLSACQH